MSLKTTRPLLRLFLCMLGLITLTLVCDGAVGAQESLVSLLPTETQACTKGEPEKCSLGLLRGQTAPFSGQLMTPKLAISLGLKAHFCEKRIELAAEEATELAQIKVKKLQTILEITQTAQKTERDLLMRKLEETTDVPLHREPWFVATTTTLVVGSVAALIIWAVREGGEQPVRVEIQTTPAALSW